MKTATSKTCKKCSTEKAASEFGPNKKLKDGLNTYCRECERNRMREKRARGPIKNPPKYKLCITCNLEKLIKEMSSNIAADDGIASICKLCDATRCREHYHEDIEFSRERGRVKAERNKEQHKEYYKKYYPKNKDKYKERAYKWRYDNAAKWDMYKLKWEGENKDRRNDYTREYYQRNIIDMLQRARDNYNKDPEKFQQYTREWQKRNRDKCNFTSAKRQYAKMQRTPKWLTEEDWESIRWFYRVARRLTELEGIQWSVDHIIPLQGKLISGLHCPTNLELLPLYGPGGNASKGNKWVPE